MDNFGVDLDQVLNEFEEQESKIELENKLRDPGISGNTHCLFRDKPEESSATALTSTDDFSKHSSNYLLNDETNNKSVSKYLDSEDDSKNHITTSNTIFSSMNMYCKHFLRENVANPVCCYESRVREESGFLKNDVSSVSEVHGESAWESQNKLASNGVELPPKEVDKKYATNVSEIANDLQERSEVNENHIDNSHDDKSHDIFPDVPEDFLGTFPSIENVILKTSRNAPISLVVTAGSYNDVLYKSDEGEGCRLDVNQMQTVIHGNEEIIFLENLKEPDANIDLNLLLKEDLFFGKEMSEDFEENSKDVLPDKSCEVLQETSVHEFQNKALDKEDNDEERIQKDGIYKEIKVVEKLKDEVSDSHVSKKSKDSLMQLDVLESVTSVGTQKQIELATNVDTRHLTSDGQKTIYSTSDCHPGIDTTVSEKLTKLAGGVLPETGKINLLDAMPVNEETRVVDEVDNKEEMNPSDLNEQIQKSEESNKNEVDKLSDVSEDEEEALRVLQEEAAIFIEKMGRNFTLTGRAECEMSSSLACNNDDHIDHGIVMDIEKIKNEVTNENILQKKQEQIETQNLSLSQINHLPLNNYNEDFSHEIFKIQVREFESDGDKNPETLTSCYPTDLNQFEILSRNDMVEDHSKFNGFQKDATFNVCPISYEDVVTQEFNQENEPEFQPNNTLICYQQEGIFLPQARSSTSHSQESLPNEQMETERKDEASYPLSDAQKNESTRTFRSENDQPRSLQMMQPQFFHAPSRCSNIDLPITELGKVSPAWLPDSSTNKCLQCETLFSFLRRRHHCRACGLIFCNVCCNVRYPLEYMSNKEERVCCKCFVDFNRASSYQNMLSSSSAPAANSRPNPSNPNEYCSTVPPALQATSNDPLPPVMVPSGVLRKQGKMKPPSEMKKVMFSDGIRPGGDLTHLDGRQEGAASNVGRKKKPKPTGSSSKKPLNLATSSSLSANKPSKSSSAKQASKSLWSPEDGKLPPLVNYSSDGTDYVLDYKESPEAIFKQATDFSNPTPLTFGLNVQLTVLVKVIKKDCCVKRDCWCFTTRGLCTVSQDEVVFLLERRPNETTIPIEIFSAISSIYDSAYNGSPVKNMSSTVLHHSESHPELCGFLYIYHSIQCLQNILLPRPPYLFAIFIKQSELTWARAFPMRLFLRLGAEFRYYPCPLFGVRDRPAVYGDIGHTIMNLLVDFRNFQYTLPAVDDMAIHVEEKNTTILIPRHKHHQVLKVLSNSDDHVLAMAGNFSYTADSHLICLQNTEGSYQTQAMNIQGRLRNVTGASFMVFNGALKAASGYTAKMSIIEDGLMVQITPDDMTALKQALTIGEDFTITCGLSSPPASSSSSSSSSSSMEGVFDGTVSIRWFSEKISKGSDQLSPIDKLNLSQVEQKKIHSCHIDDISPEGFTLIWTGLFFLEPLCASQPIRSEVEKFAESLATSCCKSLTPHLSSLFAPVPSMLSVRVNVGSDQIGYEAGVNCSELSDSCLAALDSMIIPVLHSSQFASRSPDTCIELLFIITRPINA